MSIAFAEKVKSYKNLMMSFSCYSNFLIGTTLTLMEAIAPMLFDHCLGALEKHPLLRTNFLPLLEPNIRPVNHSVSD